MSSAPKRYNLWQCPLRRDLPTEDRVNRVIAYDNESAHLQHVAGVLNQTEAASKGYIYFVLPDTKEPELPLLPEPPARRANKAHLALVTEPETRQLYPLEDNSK